MATLGTTALTLADWAKRTDDDGKTAIIVNLLSQANEIMDDMLWMECNQTTSHKTTVRTGLPQGTWRALYQGVQPTKSTTAQIVENCGNLEAYSEIDKDLADLNGNTAEFRLSEDQAFFEGLTQQMAGAIMYSNSLSTPQQIMGMTPRYATVSTSAAQSANNVIDMGGTGSTNTSIWVVAWGANTVHGLFPRAKMAGLTQRDLGEIMKQNSDGSRYQIYSSHFKWESGVCVRDWRYVTRLANIDVTLLNGVNAANLINGMIRALHRFPTTPRNAANVQDATRPSGVLGGGRMAIYCNRTVATYFDLQALNKTNVLLQMEQWDGKPVTTFRGIPIRTVDQILSTEARVT
ncbi:MAG: hypothetical protein KGL35_23020 [Bradyrhizobium sp.]|nr:hypothetical protein [Bradyrhizobium sp.]